MTIWKNSKARDLGAIAEAMDVPNEALLRKFTAGQYEVHCRQR